MLKIFFMLGVYALLLGFIWHQKSENDKLQYENSRILEINNDIAKAWMREQNRTNEEIAALTKANKEIKKEVVYVDKIKYKIIKENNSSCIDSLNAVFGRLREGCKDCALGSE